MRHRLVQRTLVAALAAAGIGSAFADGKRPHHHASQLTSQDVVYEGMSGSARSGAVGEAER
jgi:hypothetical protein